MSASKKKKSNKKGSNSNSKKNSNIEKKIETKETEEIKKEEVVANKEEKQEEIEEVNQEEKVEQEEIQEVEQEEKNEETKQEENKEEKNEVVKQEENKNEEIKQEEIKEVEDKKIEQKETKEEKPDYVKQMIKNKKRKMFIIIIIIVLLLLSILFSTVFAISNLNSTTIINGVSVKNIDVSNLSKDELKTKLTEALNKELVPEIKLKYGDDYEVTIDPEEIEFTYDIDSAIEEAYSVGRTGNIVENNYTILFSSFINKNIEIKYSYNEELLTQFVNDVNSKIPGVVVEPSYYIEEANLIVSKGTDGIQVKTEELSKEIIEKILERNAEEMIDDSYSQEIEIEVENVKASDIDIAKIYSEIHTEPQDAYYTTDPYQIFADVDGIDLEISVEEAQNQVNSEDKEEYTFALKITKAEKSIDDLGTEAFPYLVSSYSTKYDASNTNRSTNLEIAASKINGKVLMPGEEFSFNTVVGKRTIEEGYKDAKIYADGGVVDGLAGGICQISSTLYNAVLLANLEVTERRNHSFTTSYVLPGRDATVVWGTTDFKFVNSRQYPIKIEATVSNGIAEFKIHGMQEENEYEVRILPVTTGTIPYTTSYVTDATLAPGQQVVSQSGHAGSKVTTYKEVRLNGEVISNEIISNDTYSPMQTIIRVGPDTATQVEGQ